MFRTFFPPLLSSSKMEKLLLEFKITKKEKKNPPQRQITRPGKLQPIRKRHLQDWWWPPATFPPPAAAVLHVDQQRAQFILNGQYSVTTTRIFFFFFTFYHKYDGNENVSGGFARTPASVCQAQGTVIQTSLICSEMLCLRSWKQLLCHFSTQLTDSPSKCKHTSVSSFKKIEWLMPSPNISGLFVFIFITAIQTRFGTKYWDLSIRYFLSIEWGACKIII